MDFVRDNNLNQPQRHSSQKGDVLAKKAFSLHQKGDDLFGAGQFGQARDFYQKSFEAYEALGDFQGAGLALTRLGRAIEFMGEYDQARQTYQKSLYLFEKSSDLQGIARSKAHLGNIGWATGDYQEASNFLREALSFYEIAQDVSGTAWVHDLMGNLRLAMREDEEAERHYHQSYALIQETGESIQVEAWNHYHLGTVALFREQREEAWEHFSESLKIFIRLKDDLGQVAALVHLGEIACSRKDISEAEKHLQKAVQLVLGTQCKPLLADALTGVAQLLKLKGDERKAISILMVALSHPTCRQQTKDRMVSLIMALQSTFTSKEAEEGFQWAKAVSIEEMAGAWVSAQASNDNKKKSSKR